MTIKQTVDNWSSGVINDLKDNYYKLGLDASGNWGQSLEDKNKVTDEQIRIEILAAKYTGALVDGRSANRNQSPSSIRAFVGWAGNTFIKEWVERKGINASPFAIAYKIAKEGVKVPNRFNPGTLVSDVVNEDRLDLLLDSLKEVVSVNFSSDIKKLF